MNSFLLFVSSIVYLNHWKFSLAIVIIKIVSVPYVGMATSG